MGLLMAESEPSVVTPNALPQLVPNSACVRCDVCCRFPDADSFLRPYFTELEIAEAVAHGLSPLSFPDRAGSQIDLRHNPSGEGYVCPAFDTTTGHCGIYEARPLDCRLYPLALMWDAAHTEVVLGWDTKCPFLRETVPDTIAAHARQVADELTAEALIERVVANPRLIGPFQDDVVIVRSLPQLTARLVQAHPDPRLHPLTPEDAPRFARVLEQAQLLADDALAAYAFQYHFIWTPLLQYSWMETHGSFFLFARSPDGWFMPLPPLGVRSLDDASREAFRLMQEWNGHSPVSRIENVMGPQKRVLEQGGFQFRPKDADYLYQAEALARLMGDRYKSQRALCNRVEREHTMTVEPYRAHHRTGCLALYDQWSSQKRSRQRDRHDSMSLLLLEDAKGAHGFVLAEPERIGLSGTVALMENRIVAYTFGYWLTPRVWCVLLEVADRSIAGLAQWLFRDTCRTAVKGGAVAINAMDDAGLPGLREAKRAYRPTALIDNWVVTGTHT
jgi:Fe-S-cluster containining protein